MSFKEFSSAQGTPKKLMGVFKSTDDKLKAATEADRPPASRADKTPAKVTPASKS
jgi:hypothetical protein